MTKRDTLVTSVSKSWMCAVMGVVVISLVYCYIHMNKMKVLNDQ